MDWIVNHENDGKLWKESFLDFAKVFKLDIESWDDLTTSHGRFYNKILGNNFQTELLKVAAILLGKGSALARATSVYDLCT